MRFLVHALLLFALLGAASVIAQEGSTAGRADTPPPPPMPLALDAEERAFIAAHPVIRVSNELDWPPYDFSEDGKPQGYSIDMMRRLAAKIGARFEFVQGETWEDLVDAFCAHRIDVLQPTDMPAKVVECGDFTAPVFRETSQFLVRRDHPPVKTIEDLFGSTVATPAGWEQTEVLRKLYGDRLRFLETPGTREAIEAVRDGRADFATDFSNVLRYFINRQGHTNLKIDGFWRDELGHGQCTFLYIATRKDWPVLHRLMNKALAALTTEERQWLQAKWFGKTQGTVEIPTPTFSSEELAWLQTHPVIRFSAKPDWLPYERIDAAGKYEGIGADMLELMSQRLGIDFQLVSTKTWADSLENLREHRCDLLPIVSDAPSRNGSMVFTKPYMAQPLVIATRTNELFVQDTSEIGSRPVGLRQDDVLFELLRQQRPGLQLVAVQNALDGLERVRNGELWAYIDAMPSIGYTLQKYAMLDLKIAGQVEFDVESSLATRRDDPVLASIMQKAVDSISPEERRAIVGKWLAIRVEQSFDYRLLWQVIAGASLALLAVFYWNRKLARYNARLTTSQAELHTAHDELYNALHEAITQQHIADKARGQIATLLDNSGQGFLSVDSQLRIDPNYSRECKRIFGRDSLDRPLPELLYPNDSGPDDRNRRTFLAKTLSLVITSGKDPLRQEAYLELLPKEYRLNEGDYKAEYRPISAERMMLVLTDITTEKRLRDRLAQERLRLELVVNALEHRDDLLTLLHDYEHFRCRALPDLLAFERNARVLLDELFRQTHTFKGLFAQASLPTLPAVLHELETRLGELRDRGRPFDVADIKRELGHTDLGAPLRADLSLLREKLGPEYFNLEREFRVSAKLLDQLETETAEHCGTDSRLLELVRQLRFEPLQRLLEPTFKAATRLAQQQGKCLAPIQYLGANPLVDPRTIGPFVRSLVHVLRNAVDHGIEDPDTRLLADKDEAATISCQVESKLDRLTLTISDDGAGIDPAHIRARAATLQLDEARMSDDAEILQLIFANGFSTRLTTNGVSGRGVGLAAVRQAAEEIGGAVAVESTLGEGTRLIFSLPHLPPPDVADDKPADLAHTSSFLETLGRVMGDFCGTHLRLPVRLEERRQAMTADALLDFVVLISLGGELNAQFGLSIEEPLLREMTHRFEPALSQEEIEELAESVGAEIVNTLIGNAAVYLTHLDRKATMGTPDIVPRGDRASRLGRHRLQGLIGHTETGRFILFRVLSESENPNL